MEGRSTACLLLDGGGAIGVMVDDEGLPAPREGGELVKVGVLDRLSAMRRDPVARGPDSVVRVSEDEIAACRGGQGPLHP